MTTIIERTPALIAAEINGIKEQVRSTVLSGAVEIGRRLIEAKSLVPQGEWGEWLETHVDYSQRTAQNMMQLAHEFRDGKAQALADLSYTKAVLLMGVPEGDRESFASENDIESMSTRELKAMIAGLKRKEAEMQLTMDDMIAAADPARQALEDEVDRLKKDLAAARQGIEQAKEIHAQSEQQKKELRSQIQELNARDIEEKGRADQREREAQEEIDRLKKELQEAGQPIVTQVTPPDMAEKMAQLSAQAARTQGEAQLRACFDALKDAYTRLLSALSGLRQADEEKAKQFQAAFIRGLDMMKKQLEG